MLHCFRFLKYKLLFPDSRSRALAEETLVFITDIEIFTRNKNLDEQLELPSSEFTEINKIMMKKNKIGRATLQIELKSELNFIPEGNMTNDF